MKHTFTNTITTLPYGYQLKLEVISLRSDVAADTTTTVSNGGYVMSIGQIPQNVDKSPGKVNLGAMSFSLRDVGTEVSANLQPFAAIRMEARLWVSYDAGTSWECLFFGFVRLDQTKVEVRDTTKTYNTVYSFSTYHAFDPLKEIAVDFYVYPLTTNTGATISVYNTDENGAPVLMGTLASPKFAAVQTLIESAIARIPWVTAPASTTLVTTEVEAQGYNLNTTTAYPFADLRRYYNPPTSASDVDDDSYFGRDGGSGGAYQHRNYAKVLESECASLNLVPIPYLINTAGTITFEVHLVQRVKLSPTAVTTPPTLLLSEERGAAPFVQGGSIRLVGHPLSYDYELPAVTSGDAVQIEIMHATSPDIGTDPYLWARSVYQADNSGELQQNTNANTQTLYGWTGSAIVQIHQFKHNSAQSFQDPSGAGYYGVARSMYDLMMDTSSYGILVGVNEQRTRTYRGMKGATIADIRLLKSIDIGADTYTIEGINRDPIRNQMTLTLVKRQ